MVSTGLWTPQFEGTFVTHAGGSAANATDFRNSAYYWAATQWYPDVVGSIVVASIVSLLAAYEYIVHMPSEMTIWWRFTRRRRSAKRGATSFAILWLRYTTLALGITFGVAMWNANQTIGSCGNVVWPLEAALIAIVTLSTAAINSWRTRTITLAAVQSKAMHALLRLMCVFLWLARLAALVTVFVYQRKTYKYFHLLTDANQPASPVSTCTSLVTAIATAIAHSPNASDFAEFEIGRKTMIGLFATLVASDSSYAVVTLASIFRLSRDIQSRSSLIASLFNNSIMFYSMLVILDLGCLVYFITTTDGDMLAVVTVIEAILTVRVLLNEQETILAAHTYSHAHFAHRQQRMERTGCTAQHRATHALQGRPPRLQSDAPFSGVDAQRPNAVHRRTARPSDLPAHGDCDTCYVHGPIVGLGGCQWQRQPAVRYGAGLTDIERVSVVEAGRSVDRPWPQWDDDEEYEEGGVARATSGMHAIIREWWGNVEPALQPPVPDQNGRFCTRTCDGGLEHRDDYDDETKKQSGNLYRARTRSNTIDASSFLANVPGQTTNKEPRTTMAKVADEKESINNTTVTSDEQCSNDRPNSSVD